MITFDNVSKVYPDGTVAVDNLTITAPNGKITTLVGPSGCGKTTSMRMINRLIEPTSGTIDLDGVDTQTLDRVALRRRIGYVIQNAGLFPHRTVVDNVAALPRLLGGGKKETRSAAMELLERVGLDAKFASRYPWQLSGGQQQRVGVARALATDPPFLLMDEPFSAVDPIVRNQLQDEFLRLQADISKTIVMVTHDIDEALKLGDQVVVLRQGGTLAQAGHSGRTAGGAERRLRRRLRRVGPRLPGARIPQLRRAPQAQRRADRHCGTAGVDDPVDARDAGSWWSTTTGADRLGRHRKCARRLRTRQRRQPQRHLGIRGRPAARPAQLGAVEPEQPLRGHRRVRGADRHRDRPRRHRRHPAREGSEGRRHELDLVQHRPHRLADDQPRLAHVGADDHRAASSRCRSAGGHTASSAGYAAIVGTAGLLYTIPSLALFIILPVILGTKILDPINIVVALTLYTVGAAGAGRRRRAGLGATRHGRRRRGDGLPRLAATSAGRTARRRARHRRRACALRSCPTSAS